MNVQARAALQGAERRAKIDSETVRGLQLMNGGAAAARVMGKLLDLHEMG